MCRSFNRRTTRTSPSARPGDAAALAPAVRATVRAIDREQAILNLNTMTDLIRQEAFVFAYMAGLMGAFGLLALSLSSVGVYGVMAYVVSGQTHEIGIRMALGAPRGTVLAMLFRRGMWTALAGLSAGMISGVRPGAADSRRGIRRELGGSGGIRHPTVAGGCHGDRDLHSGASGAEDRFYRGTATGIAVVAVPPAGRISN